MDLQTLKPITSLRKQPEVVAALLQIAKQLGPGAALPPMRDLAKALGVAVKTLDQGLRQLEDRGVVHRRPRSGIYVSQRVLQKSIGFVLGWNIHPGGSATFFFNLLNACIRRAASHHERFSFFLDSPDLNEASFQSLAHQDLVDALAAKKLDGLLLASPQSERQEDWFRNQDLPVVCLSLQKKPYSVAVDSELLVELAVQELMKRGCRTLGLIGILSEDRGFFEQAASKYGFAFKPEWITGRQIRDFKGSIHEIGRECARHLVEGYELRNSFPDGLVICNDIMAQSACDYFQSHGRTVGVDLQIATHANRGSHTLLRWNSVLTLCEIDTEEIADAMFSMLEVLIDGGRPPNGIVKIGPRILPPEVGA